MFMFSAVVHSCAPAGMGKWGEGGGACSPPPGKVVKCFDALVMTVKCSVDWLFMHYFHNIRRLPGSLLPDPYQGFVYGPRLGTKAPGPLIWKNPPGAHVAVLYVKSFRIFKIEYQSIQRIWQNGWQLHRSEQWCECWCVWEDDGRNVVSRNEMN